MVLDNRELAFLLWLGVAVVIVVWYPNTREHLPGLLKHVFASKLTIIFAGVVLWALATVWLLWSVGAWSSSLASETIFWLLGPGIALVFGIGIGTRRDSDEFLLTTFKQVVVLTIVVEFVINLYPLPLLGEILLVPILFLLFGAEALAETRSEHRAALAPIRAVIAIIGFGLLFYTFWRVQQESEEFAAADNVRLLFLPLLLTLCFIPLLYGLDLLFSYEAAFLRIRLATEDRRRRRRARLGLLSVFGPRTAGLRAFTPCWGNQLTRADSLSATRSEATEFRAWAKERRLAPKREAERLERYAGVEGVDDEGRQLDQREFKETKKALQSLATAQMGWYRNRGGRYR